MKRSQQLPKLKIHDTEFYVDAERHEFRQVDNEDNHIAFHDLQDRTVYASLFFDTKTKNVYRGDFGTLYRSGDVQLIKLPPFDQLTQPNATRKLPVVTIAGTEFHVDVRLEELRQIDSPHNTISFDEFSETSNGKNTLFFDCKSKNVYRGTDKEMANRDDIVLIKLPSLFEMDRDGMNTMVLDLAEQIRLKNLSNTAESGTSKMPKQEARRKTKSKGSET